LYKKQKEIDWSEDEIDLEQARIDFLTCPPEIYQGMIKNLSFQWEADSIAVNSLAYLLTPFITDSDFRLAINKNTDMEGLHSLTYAEIVRLAAPDPREVIREVMTNQHITDRAGPVEVLLEELLLTSVKYATKQVGNTQETYDTAFLGLFTWYCLERLQFMSTFAHTFAIVECGYFQGIGKLVQKIMQDEYYIHCRVMEKALRHEMSTTRGCMAYMNQREKIESILSDVINSEYTWNAYMDSCGCSVPGFNKPIMDEWAQWNAQEVYSLMMIEPPFTKIAKSPLKFMDNWLDIDKFQNANQEGDNNNYSLNSYIEDTPDDYVFGWV
jgi:ribonucleoside-diphosphate reductase beta chain